MGLQGDSSRMDGQQQSDRNWNQIAAWRSLWNLLLKLKREEIPQYRQNTKDKPPTA